MSTDLERHLRAVLRDPPVPEGLHDRLRAATLAGFERPRRRSGRRVVGRSLRIAGSLAAVCAVAGVIGLLVVATPSDPSASTTGRTGVEYVLRLTPHELGVDGSDAARDAAAALRARGRSLGVSGLGVATTGDHVTVFVPRTHNPAWGTAMLLASLNVAVYDNATSPVASAPSLPALLASGRLTGGGPGPSHYYAAVPRPKSGPGFLDGPYGSHAEAARRADDVAAGLGGRGSVVKVPAEISLVLNDDHALGATSRHPYFSALRDPVVHSSGIETTRASGSTVIVVVAPGARSEVANRVQRLSRVRGETLTLMSGASVQPGFAFRGYDARTGELRFAAPNAQSAEYPARTFVGGGVDAVVTVESARPVGPAPARLGVKVGSVPSPLRYMISSPRQEPVPGTVLRVLSVDRPGASSTFYTWIGRDGEEVVGVKAPSGYDTVDVCSIAPDMPLIQPCEATGTPRHGRRILGRVGQDVSAVRAVYASGAAVGATVANGWFLMVLPAGAAPLRVEAVGASGATLGSLDPALAGGAGALFGTG